MGGGAEVVTNGAVMREEPAEMEIPLEEEEVVTYLFDGYIWSQFSPKTSQMEPMK